VNLDPWLQVHPDDLPAAPGQLLPPLLLKNHHLGRARRRREALQQRAARGDGGPGLKISCALCEYLFPILARCGDT